MWLSLYFVSKQRSLCFQSHQYECRLDINGDSSSSLLILVISVRIAAWVRESAILEQTWNKSWASYFGKLGILNKMPVWLQEASQHHGPHSEFGPICPGGLRAETSSWFLLWLEEGIWNTLAILYHPRPEQYWEVDWMFSWPVFMAEYLRDHRIPLGIATTLINHISTRGCPSW